MPYESWRPDDSEKWERASEREGKWERGPPRLALFHQRFGTFFGGKGKLSEHIYVDCTIYIQFLIRPVWRKYSKICLQLFRNKGWQRTPRSWNFHKVIVLMCPESILPLWLGPHCYTMGPLLVPFSCFGSPFFCYRLKNLKNSRLVHCRPFNILKVYASHKHRVFF